MTRTRTAARTSNAKARKTRQATKERQAERPSLSFDETIRRVGHGVILVIGTIGKDEFGRSSVVAWGIGATRKMAYERYEQDLRDRQRMERTAVAHRVSDCRAMGLPEETITSLTDSDRTPWDRVKTQEMYLP